MRFRPVLSLIISAVLFSAANASAQKRPFSVVNPNANAFSDTIDIYDPQTGTITTVRERLGAGRERPAVFQLTNGRVLVAGGVNNRYLNIADIYNPEDGSITETGEMLSVRGGMSSIIVPGGVPVILGGYNGNYLQTVEQYDSVSEKFTMTSGQMTTPRQHATATILEDGTILIAGGFNGTFLYYAEIYDSVNRTFLPTLGDMVQPRLGHSAARIAGDKVLLAGGCRNSNSGEMVCDTYMASAEIYDPEEGTFAETGDMTVARKDHTATVLNDGRVLIVGGRMNDAAVLASAEIYNPATGVFTTAGNMAAARANHTASILPDGRVVVAGGESANGAILASVEIYNPATGTFSLVSGSMSDARTLHSAVVLSSGKVLFVAGLKKTKLVFDTNYQILGDNIGGNIYFTPDSKAGFVAYTGSGTVLAFAPQEEGGGTLRLIETGGRPVHITPILHERYLAVVSALDNRIFIIDTAAFTLHATYSFNNAGFGFGSRIALSPDGLTGYVSSPETGAVIKFDVATGAERGRLSGFRTPAQITVNRSGDMLLVVDAGANTVKGVNAANMTLKYTFEPRERYYAAALSIHNKVVFTADEKMALVASQDMVLEGYSAAFLFDPATGEWIMYKEDEGDEDEEEKGGIYAVGSQPGWTMLLPGGEKWMVLTQSNVSMIPTVDPRTIDWSEDDAGDAIAVDNYAINGSPMGSANVVLTPDGRYAFFASATTDQVFHLDLEAGGIIGAYLLGEDPNRSPDQPIEVALTPDSSILAAASFVSNEITLFVDSYVYRQTRYISQQDRFTGISLVNVSPTEPAIVEITARTNSGIVHYYYDEEIPNPKTLILAPNEQISIDIHELLELDTDADNSGYLTIDANIPVVVGYTAVGQIQSSFLTSHIRSMESVAFFAAEDVPRDMIIPEIPESEDAMTEVSLLNPWYSTQTYTVTHYGADGTTRTEQEKTLNSQSRETTTASGVTTTVGRSQVVIIGGFSSSRTESTAEMFDGRSLYYSSSLSTRVARYGHTATPLPNGKVLVAGGRDRTVIHKTAETFDPTAGYFIWTSGSMNLERYRHTATRLLNGMVLLAGGQNMNSTTRTAEIFDYSRGSFSYAKDVDGNISEMNIPRDAHTATRLIDGRILIAGGLDGTGTTNTAEIYDPRTGRFTLLESFMNDKRAFHTATLLDDGKVLFTGGYNGEYLKSAEVFNPVMNRFEPVSDMSEPRSNHAAALLSDGTVLITGGRNLSTDVNEEGGLDTAEVYDPTYGYFSETGNTMTSGRSYHTAVNFKDDQDGINDRVIVSGGFGLIPASGDDGEDELAALNTSEIYTPGTRMFTRASSTMSRARQGHTALLLDEGVSSGYLRITSDMGLLASESFNLGKGDAPTSIGAINMAKYKDVTTIYSPRFVVGSGRTTRLNIVNGNEDTADITIELYSDNGAMIASRTRQLAGSAQINGTLDYIFENPAIVNTRGWIKVSSTRDQVVGTVTFISTKDSNNYTGSFELSATPAASPQYCYIFPLVTENTDFVTELSFLNSGSSAVSLTLQLWNVNGSNTSTASRHLPAGTNMYGTLSSLFGRTIDTGNVRVISNQPIHGLGEIQAKSGRFITPVPAARYACQ
jgi:N-acetylneuraminic acid mutarotase